jgi:hypothetical protein
MCLFCSFRIKPEKNAILLGIRTEGNELKNKIASIEVRVIKKPMEGIPWALKRQWSSYF